MSHIYRTQWSWELLETCWTHCGSFSPLCKRCHHLLSHSHQEFSLWWAILQIVQILLPTCFLGLSPPLQPQALVQLLTMSHARDSLSPLAGLPAPAPSPPSCPHRGASKTDLTMLLPCWQPSKISYHPWKKARLVSPAHKSLYELLHLVILMSCPAVFPNSVPSMCTSYLVFSIQPKLSLWTFSKH